MFDPKGKLRELLSHICSWLAYQQAVCTNPVLWLPADKGAAIKFRVFEIQTGSDSVEL